MAGIPAERASNEPQGRYLAAPVAGWMARVAQQWSIVLLHGVQSSRLSWWRLKQDLQDLGWQVQAVDMLGHGSRHSADDASLTIDDLARDVLVQVPEPVDILVGHSLGAIVALTLAGLEPGHCSRVVIEDPPGLAGGLDLGEAADGVEESVRTALMDPAGTVQTLLEENPVWSRVDAQNAVKNRQMLDVVRVTQLLRTSHWDLQALVHECPVPVQLLAATQNTTLTDPDRAALMNRLPAEHIVVIESGHTIHRERPALWLHYVLRFAQAI